MTTPVRTLTSPSRTWALRSSPVPPKPHRRVNCAEHALVAPSHQGPSQPGSARSAAAPAAGANALLTDYRDATRVPAVLGVTVERVRGVDRLADSENLLRLTAHGSRNAATSAGRVATCPPTGKGIGIPLPSVHTDGGFQRFVRPSRMPAILLPTYSGQPIQM